MKRVVVLGGGPAGAFTAERLAGAGMEAIVFDEKLAWEKPCGGALSYKAYRQYPFLIENATPKRMVRDARLTAPSGNASEMTLTQPLAIYSRFDLNRMLLERAGHAGARIEKERVLEIERKNVGWRVRTRAGSLDTDYCVVATGARNQLRNVGTQLTGSDTMSALGYYVASSQDHIDIQFLEDLEGYIWVFPRCGHLSAGICGKGAPAQSLRARLERYLEKRGMAYKGAAFYSHLLPSLSPPAWKKNRVAGDGWLATGDAGGLVDPITGEGIYYAIRSADLASQVVLNDACPIPEKAAAYAEALRRDFVADLEFGASLVKRVFTGRFLFSTVPERMVQFMRRSPRFREVLQDLFAGTQPYLGLKQRLLHNLNRTMLEVITGFSAHRRTPVSADFE